MNTRKLIGLFAALPMAGCIFGGAGPGSADTKLCGACITMRWQEATLPRGGRVSGRLIHGPQVILQRAADQRVLVDGYFDGWRQSVIATAAPPENLRVARSPADGLLNRTLVA